MSNLPFAIVVATRNRATALSRSLPTMLGQTRTPARIIVVDSSDNHEATLQAVDHAAPRQSGLITVVRAPRGLTRQRNIGLDLVKEPVVIFPDDDSIWFPDTADAILSIYEHPRSGNVAAVCGVESSTPPADFTSTSHTGYQMSARDRVVRSMGSWRTHMEEQLAPDPIRVIARARASRFPIHPELMALGCGPVEWMTGFRMSFRTEVIRQHRFDENLPGYALFEDRDASLRAWEHGAVVKAPRARIYHHRSPERRDDPIRMGTQQILNLAYLVAKHSQPNDPARKAMSRFLRYRVLLYRLSVKDRFGRERFSAAQRATAYLQEFSGATPEVAAEVYRRTFEQCTGATPTSVAP